MNTIEANKLIATFMGGKFVKTIDEVDYWSPPEDCPNTHNASMGKFEYNSKWDWLMPAYSKFRKMQGLPNDGYLRHCYDIEQWICRVNRYEAFRCLSDAILWYNSIKK